MGSIILRQDVGEHQFQIIENGVPKERVDLLTAEEVALFYEERNYRVEWVYPEDIREKRNKNA